MRQNAKIGDEMLEIHFHTISNFESRIKRITRIKNIKTRLAIVFQKKIFSNLGGFWSKS